MMLPFDKTGGARRESPEKSGDCAIARQD